ncbi:MAG: hypothetical protein LUH22_17825 [Bacteroides sp.]|nr:hypothetical protein [Bacteroides sp.]
MYNHGMDIPWREKNSLYSAPNGGEKECLLTPFQDSLISLCLLSTGYTSRGYAHTTRSG